MPIPWHAVGDYVAPIVLGGAGAFGTFIALLPTKFGERLVGQYFERRIANLKHEQSVELGKMQAELDHLKDRGTRSNEREYQAIQQSWERFVEAFRTTKTAVMQFLQYPDLDRMLKEDVVSFLEANGVPERSKSYILEATDKKRAFSNYIQNKCINDAGSAIESVRDTLHKQSVFIPSELYNQFDNALTRLHHAWVEQRMASDYENIGDRTASMALVGKEGQPMFDSLRDAVRARLLRTA